MFIWTLPSTAHCACNTLIISRVMHTIKIQLNFLLAHNDYDFFKMYFYVKVFISFFFLNLYTNSHI